MSHLAIYLDRNLDPPQVVAHFWVPSSFFESIKRLWKRAARYLNVRFDPSGLAHHSASGHRRTVGYYKGGEVPGVLEILT